MKKDVNKQIDEVMEDLSRKVTYTCVKCGFDLSEKIASIPEDGEVHKFMCPNCADPNGTEHVVRRTPRA